MMTVEYQVADPLQSKYIDVNRNNMEVYYSLKCQNQKAKSVVSVCLFNRKHKITLFRQGKQLKGTNGYFNEHHKKQNKTRFG